MKTILLPCAVLLLLTGVQDKQDNKPSRPKLPQTEKKQEKPAQSKPSEAGKKQEPSSPKPATGEQQEKPSLPKLPESGQKESGQKGAGQKESGQKESGKKQEEPSQLTKVKPPGQPPIMNPITGQPWVPGQSPPFPNPDLVQRFQAQNPLLGVWRLHRNARPGATVPSMSGYLIFTNQHMSLNLMGGEIPRGSFFQTSIRSYRLQGMQLITTSLMGVRAGMPGRNLMVEARGYREVRRILLMKPGLLRIYRNPNSFLEFVKVEDIK